MQTQPLGKTENWISEHIIDSAIEKSGVFSTELGILYLDNVYELELAFYEDQLLADEELRRNAGYFASIGDTYTRHFLMCSGESLKLPDQSSSRLKSFFQKNQFRTGYATHGLLP